MFGIERRLVFFFYQLCNIDSSFVKMTPPRDHIFFLYCHIISRKFEVLVTRNEYPSIETFNL